MGFAALDASYSLQIRLRSGPPPAGRGLTRERLSSIKKRRMADFLRSLLISLHLRESREAQPIPAAADRVI
jgi:hypothetical protein